MHKCRKALVELTIKINTTVIGVAVLSFHVAVRLSLHTLAFSLRKLQVAFKGTVQ